MTIRWVEVDLQYQEYWFQKILLLLDLLDRKIVSQLYLPKYRESYPILLLKHPKNKSFKLDNEDEIIWKINITNDVNTKS